ncbi:histidine kinase [Streptomyces sp. NPDC048659]|uniref:sensor histidine kinase n=1 Tax=Streptomyces sp. NPDC048659 TaxID=3155489 RepID=UPI00342E5A3D
MDLSGALHRSASRIRAFDTARPRVWDTVLTLLWTGAALVDATGGGWRSTAADPTAPQALVTATTLALTLPLYARRRHPTAVLAALAGAALVSAASGALLQAAYLQALPLYHLARTRPPRTLARTALLLLPALATTAATATTHSPRTTWPTALLPPLAAYALATLLGLTTRARAERRAQEVRLAAAGERARIAREMHDIIGHSLSVITGLADGGRYAAAKRPERAAQALDAIADTSREALTDLRRLLDVLREDTAQDPSRTPQPTLSDLEPLLEGVRKAGLKVTSDLPRSTPPALSPGAQLTVYRVIQEALTNTLKHAGAQAEAHVQVRSTRHTLTATITNTGKSTGQNKNAGTGTGRGLPGMRERAALYNGTLACGPSPKDGGWHVRLELPLPAPPENHT